MTTDGAIPPARDGATTALHRRIEELTDQLQKTAQPPDYAEARAALNEAPSLHRRIEELTAELAEAMRSGEVVAGLLATERAAREQAEAETDRTQRETNDAARVYLDRIQALEGELNAANELADDEMHKRTQAEREREEARSAARDWREHAQRAVSERDTALARVKELEPWEKRYDKLNGQYEWQAEQLVKEYDRRVAAETALASARELLERLGEVIEDYGPGRQFDTAADALDAIIQLLASHPAGNAMDGAPMTSRRIEELTAREQIACKVPVDADVCGKKCDHGSECLLLRGHEGGHDTQHGCTFYDAAPVAAPCAGCADAKVLLSEARARLPQDRRPHSFFRRAGAWLKEHP